MTTKTVTQTQVDEVLRASRFEAVKLGQKTLALHCTLPNGFELCESAACVDPERFSAMKGIEIAAERIVERIWLLEGYALQLEIKRERDTDGVPERPPHPCGDPVVNYGSESVYLSRNSQGALQALPF